MLLICTGGGEGRTVGFAVHYMHRSLHIDLCSSQILIFIK